MWEKRDFDDIKTYGSYLDAVSNVEKYMNKEELEKFGIYTAIAAKKGIDFEEELEEEEEEEIDNNLLLVEFYGKLLIEKIARFPILGKMNLKDSFEVENINNSNLYEVSINVDHNIINQSIDYAISVLEESKLIEDDINTVSITLDECLIIKVKVNCEDLQNLKPAEKAVSKFNL